jgi:hypothetical protein
MSKAVPTPVQDLDEQSKQDEQELSALREQANQPTEQLAEESLPSEDKEEQKPEPDEEKAKEPQVEEQTTDTEKPPEDVSSRAQERYKKLSQERREALAEAQRLREENQNLYSVVKALQEQGYTKKEAQEIAEESTQDGYIDHQGYLQEVERRAKTVAERTIAEREAYQAKVQSAERYKEDLKVVEEKYPILNEDSEEYDEGLSELLGEFYTNRLEKNPRARLTETVEQFMSARERAIEKKTQQTITAVAKQASRQAMTPSGGMTEPNSLARRLEDDDLDEVDLKEIRKQLPVQD